MSTASAHEFFAASASVAGALIGLLFVAISVTPERILGPDASQVHGIRAAATLTAFTNALAVSLFDLIPNFHAGGVATAVSIVGLLFVGRALVYIVPAWRADELRLRDLGFLVSLLVVFVVQLIAALELDRHANDRGSLQTICVLVVVCFLIGIERAWELVGGPKMGLGSLVRERLRAQEGPVHEDTPEHEL